MSLTARFIVRNLDGFVRQLEKEDEERRRAAHVATRVEANRLRLAMKEEIREGAPGGQKFSPLSGLAGWYRKNKAPIARLAIPVRYWADNPGKQGRWVASVGFVKGPVTDIRGGVARNNQTSASWVKIARRQQEGFDESISAIRRRLIIRIGGRLKKRGLTQEAKFHFLRPATTVFSTPARPIIVPFWRAHQAEALRNIEANFERKLKGERI